MLIPLKPDSKPVKHRLYRLNLRYKENVKIELERILDATILEPIEESEWIIPMLVLEKKTSEVRICVKM